jgi:hypothetical protein
MSSTDAEVLAWYQERWNKPLFLSFKRPTLTLETSLSTGDYPWCWEDGEDILVEYFAKFHVDQGNFIFTKYWPNEGVFMLLNFLRSKDKKRKWTEPKPLTLKMLAESAKAGRWLYD